MVSRNITLVPSLGLRIGPACEASLSASMRRERVPPGIRKRKRKKEEGSLACVNWFRAVVLFKLFLNFALHNCIATFVLTVTFCLFRCLVYF